MLSGTSSTTDKIQSLQKTPTSNRPHNSKQSNVQEMRLWNSRLLAKRLSQAIYSGIENRGNSFTIQLCRAMWQKKTLPTAMLHFLLPEAVVWKITAQHEKHSPLSHFNETSRLQTTVVILQTQFNLVHHAEQLKLNKCTSLVDYSVFLPHLFINLCEVFWGLISSEVLVFVALPWSECFQVLKLRLLPR